MRLSLANTPASTIFILWKGIALASSVAHMFVLKQIQQFMVINCLAKNIKFFLACLVLILFVFLKKRYTVYAWLAKGKAMSGCISGHLLMCPFFTLLHIHSLKTDDMLVLKT